MVNDTTEQFRQASQIGLEQMQALTSLNLQAWNQAMERQLSLAGALWQSGLERSGKLAAAATDPTRLAEQQLEFGREVGETLLAEGRKSAQQGIEFGRQYQELAADGIRRLSEIFGSGPSSEKED